MKPTKTEKIYYDKDTRKIKDLEIENARLKEENESIKLLNEQKFWSGYKQATQRIREENIRLRQALEKIKKEIEDIIKQTEDKR